jgi:tRNA pseudouridine-54 N-methylase
MKFFLLFDSTPLTSAVPLKALTSQGMRLDVACRMLRACVLGPDGRPSGHSVSAWFSGGGREAPARLVDIDGRVLDARVAAGCFRSELVLARHLKGIIAGIARGTGENVRGGIKLQVLDGGTSAPDAFIDSIKREKHEAGKEIVLLHEHGIPILDGSRPGILAWKQVQGENAVIVVGNHQGFPAHVEKELLSISDHIFAIGVGTHQDSAGQVSYLGSQVIAFIQMFHTQALRLTGDKRA